MSNIEREELISLYDIYESLLTEKQRLYFEDYYYSDLSLAEIAENYEVSRNAVFDQLKKVEELLISYEEKLSLKKKYNSILELVKDESLKKKIIDIFWEE